MKLKIKILPVVVAATVFLHGCYVQKYSRNAETTIIETEIVVIIEDPDPEPFVPIYNPPPESNPGIKYRPERTTDGNNGINKERKRSGTDIRNNGGDRNIKKRGNK
ncbi:MAG: hypothetical protein JW995_06510 [Melioribacteraceae bacterium]|nr:hypothetical protein [Melioribacteraceae bacterium]